MKPFRILREKLRRTSKLFTSDGFSLIDQLIKPQEHIRFTEELLKRYQIPDASNKRIQQILAGIRRRMENPNLQLAVIGEFSSGKSTFINALLRDRLLPAKCLPTTVAETRLVYGPFKVKAASREDPSKGITVDIQGRCPHVNWLREAADLSLRQLIPLVTAEGRLAHRVSDVVLSYPSEFLSKNTDLIDTPGMNAAEDGHAEITLRIIDEAADIVVILVSATQPVSEQLIEFLQGPVRPFIPRCIFVVTKIDLIPENERVSQVEYIQYKLSQTLGLPNLIVLACAPEMVLKGEPVWETEFKQVEAEITAHLQRHKMLCIAEKLCRLMDECLSTLDMHIKDELSRQREVEAQIKRDTIQDLDAFLNMERVASHERFDHQVERFTSEVRTQARKVADDACATVRTHIMEASTLTEIKTYLDSGIQSTFGTMKATFAKSIQATARSFSAKASQEAAAIDARFQEAYQRLDTLKSRLSAGAPNFEGQGAFNLLSIGSVGGQAVLQMEALDNWAIGGGAAAGAVIGSFIFPVVGTIIGTLVGGVLGALCTPSLGKQKTKIWNAINGTVRESLDQFVEQAVSNALAQARDTQKHLDNRLAEYGRRYAADVAKIRNEHATNLDRAQELQRTASRDMEVISDRRNTLQRATQKMTLV